MKRIPVGTLSILIGAHCWFIHPWFVALGWWRLFGFPTDFRLWVGFWLHDLGYWGLPNMDGTEGEAHPEWAANVMHRWFDKDGGTIWRDFCLYHSRFYAKRDGAPVSRLCYADKLACAFEPWWLYLPRVTASGEINEYLAGAGGRTKSKYNGEPVVSKYLSLGLRTRTKRQWHSDMTEYLQKWVAEHYDGREDTWTPTSVN